MLRHLLPFSALVLLGAALVMPAQTPAAAAAAPASKCAVGEETASHKGTTICKPIAGKCGKGRRNAPHHRYPDLVVCEADARVAQAAHVEITCPDNERPYLPKNKTVKPFCEPVGRCAYGRVAVNADVPGKKMCIKK